MQNLCWNEKKKEKGIKAEKEKIEVRRKAEFLRDVYVVLFACFSNDSVLLKTGRDVRPFSLRAY